VGGAKKRHTRYALTNNPTNGKQTMLHNHTGYILTDTSLQVLEMGLAALRATGEESCRLPLEGYASGSRTLTQFDATLTSAGLARRV